MVVIDIMLKYIIIEVISKNIIKLINYLLKNTIIIILKIKNDWD
jgi:hypothetical protein